MNKYTELANGVSRSSSQQLPYLVNNSGVLQTPEEFKAAINNLPPITGINTDILMILFLVGGLFLCFFLLYLKFGGTSGQDI